jgi:Tfp pilus assembly ATPase PilU
MKKVAAVLAGVVLLIGGAGCGLIPTEMAYWDYRFEKGYTQNTDSVQSPAERMHTHRQVAAQDARAFVDDWDYVWLKDRPSRLSRWHNR